jgi:uncharacterized protein HemY
MNHKDFYELGRKLLTEQKYSEAVEAFHASAKLAPHFKTYELLGECYLALQQAAQAIPFLAAATTLNQGVRAPSLLAEVFLTLGDLPKAKEIAEIALSRDSTNSKAKSVLDQVKKVQSMAEELPEGSK